MTLAALALLPLPASAQTVYATCQSGSGCSCAISPVTAEDLAFAAPGQDGVAAPVDMSVSTLVIDQSANVVYWSDQSRTAIQSAYGGSGDCPITGFDETEIVPRDGTWLWRQLGVTTRGCPAMLGQMIDSGREETLAESVVWDGAFHPARLAQNLPAPEIGEMRAYEWRELGPNRWLSDNLQGRDCDDGTCVSVALRLSMNVVSESRITGLLSTSSKVEGGDPAMLAMFGMGECEARIRYAIEHVGG